MRRLSIFAIFFCMAASIQAQTATATVTGTVSDPSGAVVANATVELKNTANGQIYSSVSTETGNYAVSRLPVGSYEMTVAVPGFKTYTRHGLVFSAAQVARIDLSLEVGAATESITVTAETSLLKTENAAVAHNVTISQLYQLPILSMGGSQSNNTSGYRDPFALAAVLPGVQYRVNNQMVINGTPNTTAQYRIEGQVAMETGGLRLYTTIGQPSVDAIQEVAVQTSSYAAEFGTVGGGIFNVTMKSGTNQFHGSGYDYAANEILNAHQPFTGLRNPTKRHNFGFTFGGPVWIPGVYDGTNKTFFFVAEDQFRENLLVTNTVATVPIPAYREGIFTQLFTGNNNQLLRVGASNYTDPLGGTVRSGTIFDPATQQTVQCTGQPNCPAGSSVLVRSAFPNNSIPASRFDPVATKVLAMVPLPIGPNSQRGQVGNNFQNPWVSQTRSHIPSVKADQSIGANHRLSFYYQKTGQEVQYSQQNGNMEGLPEPITAARGSHIYTHTVRLNWDYTLRPTVLFHFGAGWYFNNFDDSAATTNYNALEKLGLKGATLNRNFPNFIVGSTGVNTGGMNNLGPAGSIQGTGGSERRPSAVLSLSWVKGNHTYKWGGEWRGERYPTTTYGASAGAYTFTLANPAAGTTQTTLNATAQTALDGISLSQGSTGFPFAAFLLGAVSQFRLDVPSRVQMSKSQWALFAQDTWKVTRKLTLDYGLRWDLGTYGREKWGQSANFSPTIPNPSAGGHPGGQIFERTCGCRFAFNYPYAVGPRLGLAYQLNSKTVIRGGFGIVYSGTTSVGANVSASAFSGVPGFAQAAGQLQFGIPDNVAPRFPVYEANVGQFPGTVVNGPGHLDPNAGRPARQYQWSFGVQREITPNLVIEASYVANRGNGWVAAALAPRNVMSEDILKHRGFTIGNSSDATLLTRRIDQLTPLQQSTLASRGVFLPYSGFPATQNVRQSLLPFPQYTSTFNPTNAPLGKTWYDSLQLSVTKRFSHGLALNANYTFSKTLDLLSSPDVFNRPLGKNLANTDLPHQLRITGEYQTQDYSRRGIPVLSNRVVAYLVGNWGIGFALQYQSAPILNRPASNSPFPINLYLNRGPGPAQLKIGPDGKPMNPWSVDWVDYNGVRHTDPIDINCRCFDPTKTIVLNPNAWENIPDGQWANNFSSIRNYRGIRLPSENMNLSRNFRFKEGRVNLNVRVEFTNIFNRLQLPQPVTNGFNANPTRFPALNADGTPNPNAGLYSGGFGTILPTSGTGGFRTGQFVGRITF
jgi:hypothetical protein